MLVHRYHITSEHIPSLPSCVLQCMMHEHFDTCWGCLSNSLVSDRTDCHQHLYTNNLDSAESVIKSNEQCFARTEIVLRGSKSETPNSRRNNHTHTSSYPLCYYSPQLHLCAHRTRKLTSLQCSQSKPLTIVKKNHLTITKLSLIVCVYGVCVCVCVWVND